MAVALNICSEPERGWIMETIHLVNMNSGTSKGPVIMCAADALWDSQPVPFNRNVSQVTCEDCAWAHWKSYATRMLSIIYAQPAIRPQRWGQLWMPGA